MLVSDTDQYGDPALFCQYPHIKTAGSVPDFTPLFNGDVCAAGASDGFAASGKSDAAPVDRRDVMCSAPVPKARHFQAILPLWRQ